MENRNILVIFICIFMIGLVSADFNPRGNIDMHNLYSINNGVISNFTTYFGDGSGLTGVTGNDSFNQVLTDSLYASISVTGDICLILVGDQKTR